MLRRVHKQLQAGRLSELLANCPLVLVYQTLGIVRSGEVKLSVQHLLDKQLPNSGLRVNCLAINNSVGKKAKGSALPQYLQASNILVGWQAANATSRDVRITPDSSVPSILDPSLAGAAVASPHCAPGLTQPTLAALIDLSGKLSSGLPMALLAGFYQGQQVKMKHLQEWKKLDAGTIQTALLAELDGIAVQLLDLEGVAQGVHQTLDSVQPHELLAGLDSRELA
ncbi:hypothetical protein QJQ45_028907 [Haematococcus lacustris]|nr:hypothetical protein QJQ45_028907 [Haematococcus lacustris]